MGVPAWPSAHAWSKTSSPGCGAKLFPPTNPGPANFTLVATGGFGRGWLFPFSDIDLLFLFADRDAEQAFKDPVRRFSQELWDLRLKLSPASRTLVRMRPLRSQQH